MYTYGMYTYGMYTYGMYTYGIIPTEFFQQIFLTNFNFFDKFFIFLPLRALGSEYLRSCFFLKEGWNFFFFENPKIHQKKKTSANFQINEVNCGNYFSFKNWYNKLVSDLMSMLNYTGIVENAALWSGVIEELFWGLILLSFVFFKFSAKDDSKYI